MLEIYYDIPLFWKNRVTETRFQIKINIYSSFYSNYFVKLILNNTNYIILFTKNVQYNK